MAHMNHRRPTYIPEGWQREVLSRFTKADLAEIAWDLVVEFYCLSADRSEAASLVVMQELARRRDVVKAARA